MMYRPCNINKRSSFFKFSHSFWNCLLCGSWSPKRWFSRIPIFKMKLIDFNAFSKCRTNHISNLQTFNCRTIHISNLQTFNWNKRFGCWQMSKDRVLIFHPENLLLLNSTCWERRLRDIWGSSARLLEKNQYFHENDHLDCNFHFFGLPPNRTLEIF